METSTECPVCKSQAGFQVYHRSDKIFYDCPVCGRYEITIDGVALRNENRLAHYLYYNRFKSSIKTEYRYHTTLSKDICDNYRRDFLDGIINNGCPVHMDIDIINAWYPKSFSERVDLILLRLDSLAQHIGQAVSVGFQEMTSLLFIDRREQDVLSSQAKMMWRNEMECIQESNYMLDYLVECGYIKKCELQDSKTDATLTLTPKGYARVDDLQKSHSAGRNALVAMQFGDSTIPLREAIRKGIQDAGYSAIFIDEVEHNNLITPELMKYIRDSKFVVADLTHQNNGAYFEEGYAYGLGKPVIQLCQKGTKLHFDIAQKNTIMWETEDDIPERLANRIRATID